MDGGFSRKDEGAKPEQKTARGASHIYIWALATGTATGDAHGVDEARRTKVRVRAAMLQYAYASISYMVPTTHRVRLGFAAVELGASV